MLSKDGLLLNQNPAPMPAGPPTVAHILDHAEPGGTALIDRCGSLTYQEVSEAVRNACAALKSLGLRRGDRLAASCGNHNALIIAFLAAQQMGVVWVGVNKALAAPEKCAQLRDCGAKVLLADEATAAQIKDLRADLSELEQVLTTDAGPMCEWPTLIRETPGDDVDLTLVDRLAPAVISYTSGTTGEPKGAVHTQHSIMTFVNAGLHSGRGGIWQKGLRRSVTIALTILNGMTYGPLTALASGGSFVSMDRIDSEGVAEWIQRTRIEMLGCTPPTIRDLLLKPELQAYDTASLRYVLAGGATGAAELKELFRARYGSLLIDEYGLTESPSGVAGSLHDAPIQTGAIGRAYPQIEVAALSREGEILPAGEVGEISLRAVRDGRWAGVYTGMIGYWRKPEETSKAIRGGWICTGDLGAVDAAGNVSIAGRLKELIIRGGANIYPAEVERVLRSVEDVEDAVVVGLPDERLGEVVAAYLILKHSRDQRLSRERIETACRAQLARYKAPEFLFVVDEFPRNAMNKVDKKRLLSQPRRDLAR